MCARRLLAADLDARQVVGGLAVLLGLLAAGALLTGRYGGLLTDPAAVRAAVAALGPFAPVGFVLLQAAQVIVAPVPGHVLSFAAGYLFGPLWGFVYSMVGATLGTLVAMGLARRYGRPWVERVISPAALDRFDAALGEYGLLGVFLVFLLPGFPDDVVCLVAGVSELDLRRVLVASVLGRAPGYAVLVASGAGLAEGRLLEVGLLLSVAAAVVAVLAWRRRALLAWLDARLDTAEP